LCCVVWILTLVILPACIYAADTAPPASDATPASLQTQSIAIIAFGALCTIISCLLSVLICGGVCDDGRFELQGVRYDPVPGIDI
jgi:hypothetical protein